MLKTLCRSQQTVENSSRDVNTRPSYLLRNLYATQEEPDVEQQTGSKLGKEHIKAVYCHAAYLNYMQSTSCEMPGWMEAQAGIKTAKRNINNLRYADDTTFMAESEEEPKSLLMKVKESEKAGLKVNIQKTKTMAYNSITSWQTDRDKVETVTDFIFLGSKITTDGDYNHEIKRCLLAPWKNSYDKRRQHIKKQRHYFANKDPSRQSFGFSSNLVWMWGLDYKESWVLKNWRFWTMVLEKTLESPLDCKEIQPVHPKGN